MLRICLFFLLSLFLSTTPLSARERVEFAHLSDLTTLSQISVNGLYQDEIGRLWIGTRDGIKIFDGNRITPISPQGFNTWISSGYVPTLCGDGKGHVFINSDYTVLEYDIASGRAHAIFHQEDQLSRPSIAFAYGRESLWIGLDGNIYNYSGYHAVLKYKLPGSGNVISSVAETSSGMIYAGTRNNGLYRIRPGLSPENILPGITEVITIYEDSRGCVWAGTLDDGLFLIRPDGTVKNMRHETGQCTIGSNYVRAVSEDDNGDIWVGTMNGVDRIDRATGEIEHFGLSDKFNSGLSNLSVWVIYKDKQGTMWFGTYYGGLDYCNPKGTMFRYYDVGLNRGNNYSVVSSIVEDPQNRLWIGTEGNGLVRFSPATGEMVSYTQGPGSVPHNNIKALHLDPDGGLWIGTHIGGFCRYDLQTGKFTYYEVDTHDPVKRNESVQSIVRVGDTLYIGTISGLYYMDIASGELRKLSVSEQSIFTVEAMLADGEGNLWIAGNSFCRYNVRTGGFEDFDARITELTGASKVLLTSLARYGKDHIAIGTAGFGMILYDKSTGNFSVWNKETCGMANDYIGCVFEGDSGNMLAGTLAGLSIVDVGNGRSTNYDASNGFKLHGMIPGAIMRRTNGEIVMGGMNGIASLLPDRLSDDEFRFDLWFSSLSVNNRTIRQAGEDGILAAPLHDTRKLVLKSHQNNLVFEIGQDNFANFGQPDYQYRLEGFETEWTTFRPNNQIRYTNLPPGRYTLRVRAHSFARSPSVAPLEMKIRIRPPLYATWYAYLFYGVFVIAMLAWVVHFYQSRILYRSSLEFERRDKEQREEINQSKLRFFANISHELRTPLTLIMGQLELLLMSGNLPQGAHKSVNDIYKGGNRMHKLINELLDFLKYDQGMFRLRIEKADLVTFLREIYDSFSGLAELKNMDFTFTTDVESLDILFDRVQLQKVVNNLLANAFKYTGEGGAVKVVIACGPDTVRVVIEDNGIGIPEDRKDKIFERFYQLDNPENRNAANTGTGIGLSLTRSILEAHHGSVWTEAAEVRGSRFIVELQRGTAVFDGDPKVERITATEAPADSPVVDGGTDAEFLEELGEQHREALSHHSTLLIVEDDKRLRQLLVRIFEPVFRILEASNGEQGFEIARQESPALILSDVMMPNMSGIELCRRIKSDFNTSHIPVVLLTALDSVEQQVQGLNCGADDYIAKPFHVRLLVTRCISILNNRRLMQQRYSRQEESTPEVVAGNALDREFIEKAVVIVENNIEHGKIDVSVLCSELGVSRTKLFLKMKGILDQTPHEFIQNIKLKVAARMLRQQPDMNIGDITFFLGFSSLNYFGRYFKNSFGVSPSVYRKSAQSGSEPE